MRTRNTTKSLIKEIEDLETFVIETQHIEKGLPEVVSFYPPQPVKKLTKEEIKVLEDHMRKGGKL